LTNSNVSNLGFSFPLIEGVPHEFQGSQESSRGACRDGWDPTSGYIGRAE
jgi:hypothetical protein